jgi:carbonic anhydrase
MLKSGNILLCFFLMLSSTLGYGETNDSAIKILWDYQGDAGPAHWGELTPAFAVCSTGKMQSPINIAKRIVKTPPTLSLSYEPAPLRLVDDGLTTLTLGADETVFADGHGIQLDFPEDKTKEAIMLDDRLYRLVQLHVHAPSEHQLHGQTYPMEIHLVHQGNNGTAVVIGVFVQAGAANPALKKIIDNMPSDQGVEHLIESEQVNPRSLLPITGGYYSYPGSLTTPPCTEGVQWVVIMNPITASQSQIAKLRQAVDGDNARPVQSQYKRTIYSSRK